MSERSEGAATGDDPQENQRAYRAAVVAFAAAIVGGVVAAIAYSTDDTDVWLGVGLAVALGGIGFGLVSWAKYLDFDEHVVQQREPLTMTETERDALHEELTTLPANSTTTFRRRRLLTRLLGGSLFSLVVGFVGPLGSLGPKPRGERNRTGWSNGVRLVTSEGQPIERATGRFDQLVTVFPEGQIGRDDSQVVLLRVSPELLTERTVEAGSIDGWVAYSKICTHAGCSVGLFGIDTRPPDVLRQLVCPCHQSVFDPVDGARPVTGPATRSLPQLPLRVDADGYLAAADDFDRPVGPPTWDEG